MSGTQIAIQALIAVIAAAGLGLSIYNTVVQRRDKRPQLKVRGSPCFLPGARPDPGYPFYCFDVTNLGERALTLNNIQIGVRGNQNIVYPHMEGERPLPCRLEHWESAKYWVELEPLQDRLAELGYSGEAQVVIRAHDALGNVYEAPARINLSLGR